VTHTQVTFVVCCPELSSHLFAFSLYLKQESESGSETSGSEGEEESESDWGSESESSSSEDEEAGAYAQLKGRARWLKKTTDTTTKVTKDKDQRARLRQEAKEKAAAEQAKLEAVTATKSILPEEGLTPAVLNRRVKELAMQRGRKGKDHRQLLRELEALSRLSLQFGPRIEIPILMYVISAQFGLQRTLDDVMDTPTWKSCAAHLQRIADVLDEGYKLGVEEVDESDLIMKGKNKKMKAAANAADGAMAAVAADEKLINPRTGEPETEDERAERVRQEKEAAMTEEEKKEIPVVGSLSLHLSRLEEEYVKSLQKTSHHSADYIVRLRDESKLVELLARFQAYFEAQNATSEAAQLGALRIEHLYYRHDTIAKQVDKAAAFYEKFGEASMLHPACLTADEEGKGETDFAIYHPGAVEGKPTIEDTPDVNFTEVMSELCKYVYKHGSDKEKTRTIICQIYHHALHDRFIEGRDLLLMSHLQETIYDAGDVSTMVLFNRMMVTLGMCAFRLGRIHDAHQCLSDICSGRVRELLAQGVNTSRFSDKSAEQEKAEKRRLVPYHQHINLDLLEACHLISAMLLEVPNMAGWAVSGDGSHRRYRVISRTFRKFYDQYNHQVFTGPPEQTRDFVMRASKALMKGDWKTCADLTTTLDVWRLVPGEGAATQIAEMLTGKIKLEGLRTYLFAFSAQYDSLSLSQLCGMFEMSKNEVHSVVSKMIINRELAASWDQPTETIVLRKVEPTSLQLLALQFAEKAAVLVEANERLLDSQSGSYGYREDHWKGDREDRWQGRTGGYRASGGDRRSSSGRGFQRRSGSGRGDRRGSGGDRRGSGGRGGGRRRY
jgi:translation initiation factor 3 subunit C